MAQTDTSAGVYGSITLSGSSASLKINGNSYTLIQSMSQLDALDGYNAATGTGTAANVNGYYALAQNLIASGTYQDALVKQFNGVFTGLGHKIDGLTIDTGSSSGYGYGLFGLVGLPDGSGVVRDIGLTNANLNARSNKYAGALIGVTFGDVKNAYATGSVTGSQFIGGLIGAIDLPNPLWGQFSKTNSNTISNSFANVTVTAGAYSGGLVGVGKLLTIVNSHASGDMLGSGIDSGGLIGQANSVSIANSYATGRVTGSDQTGGLVGYIGSAYSYDTSPSGSILNSFATGNVTGGGQTGGLVGTITLSDEYRTFTISNSYATGNVICTSGSNVGGLIGNIDASNGSKGSIVITKAYATGNVTMTGTAGDNIGNAAGGLIGHTYINVTLSDSYATGDVTGATGGSYVGGLIGDFSNVSTNSAATSSITNCYATGDVSGTKSVGGLVGNNGGRDTISGSYATGDVNGHGLSYDGSGGGSVGGFVGTNGTLGTITNSYSTGNVYGLK